MVLCWAGPGRTANDPEIVDDLRTADGSGNNIQAIQGILRKTISTTTGISYSYTERGVAQHNDDGRVVLPVSLRLNTKTPITARQD